MYGSTIDELNIARSNFSNDPGCDGVLDEHCGEDGGSFKLCEKGKIKDGTLDYLCVYRKTSNLIHFSS